MNTCPHCGDCTISTLEKWRATQEQPAQCEACGGLSFVPHAIAGGIFVGSVLLMVASGFAASALQDGTILIPGSLISVAYYLWRRSKSNMTITGQTSALQAKRRSGWLLGFWLLVSTLFN